MPRDSSNHIPLTSEVLMFCQHTASTRVRSGVQRVVVELARELRMQTSVDFVKWDDLDGQLRLMDRRDLKGLFGEDIPPNPAAHRVFSRFDDLFEGGKKPWLLFPEIPSHLPNGNEVFARIVSQCREYGIRVAVIFYDLIPVREAAYAAGRASHLRYMADLVRCDLIIPISKFAGDDLLDYYEHTVGFAGAELERLQRRIRAVALGESRRGEAWANEGRSQQVSDGSVRMVMVGTVEPRKQQTRLLRVLNENRQQHAELANLQVDIYGSLHPDSSDSLWQAVADNPNIRFHHYAPERDIEAAYSAASFTAFPSMHEGYGLPIVESLRRGVPCLTANFGAMAEVAEGGGCVTLDVRQDSELLRGLLCLAGDAALRERLRGEISLRPRRSWVDYGQDVLALAAGEDQERAQGEAGFMAAVTAWAADGSQPVTAVLHGSTWALQGLGDASSTADVAGLVLSVDRPIAERGLGAAEVMQISTADLLLLNAPADVSALVRDARHHAIDRLLPDTVLTREAGATALAAAALQAARRRAHASLAAVDETMYQRANRDAPLSEGSMEDLAIIISTYNRGPFVEMNVEWLLRQIDEHALPVRCMVVDNASTDDTASRLSRFSAHPSFTYECNSANTGMLGNLHVCSTKVIARYVWVTGDDDFIAPGALGRTLEAIRQHRGIPLLLHNFGVYHRERITPGDHPEMFFAELQPLASEASVSGCYPTSAAAAEHDNLFTAIYPIVFRSDLFAACFNYPFNGVPFVDLVECVPTTKYILETLAKTQAYWFKEIGIVGNAHNSWSGHRPRWHLLLMPEVIRLARRAGVDPTRLWQWGRVHKHLFEDAVSIAIDRGLPAHLSDPVDFETASVFFQEQVVAPPGLQLGLKSEFWNTR